MTDKKKDDDTARFMDVLHPDWDPRNFPPGMEARLRKHLDHIEPTPDALLRLLAQGAIHLNEMAERIQHKHELAKLAGYPPPEPTSEEAAIVVGVAQGAHLALDVWFTKMIAALQKEARAQAKAGAQMRRDHTQRTGNPTLH